MLEFLSDALNVGEGISFFFFWCMPGCQSNVAVKSAPIKGICKEFHDNVNTPFHHYRGKEKRRKLIYYFF